MNKDCCSEARVVDSAAPCYRLPQPAYSLSNTVLAYASTDERHFSTHPNLFPRHLNLPKQTLPLRDVSGSSSSYYPHALYQHPILVNRNL